MRFVSGGYIPTKRGIEFHAAARAMDNDGAPRYLMLGGSRGGGKSLMVLGQAGLDDCLRIPNLKVLFLRKIKISAAESMEDLVYKLFAFTDHEYLPSKGLIKFPNGSRILIGGFNNADDILKYIGIEYDLVIIEDAQMLTWDKVERIGGSLRSTKSGWRTRMYLSSNPGGLGRQWIYQRFWLPYKAVRKNEVREGRDTWFIRVQWSDNPYLKVEYKKYLLGLTGMLRTTWTEGDYDSFEGMAFPTWSDRHIVEPFEIPDYWAKWCGLDWGKEAPFVCLWLAKHPDTGRIYVYREYAQRGLTDRQQARVIRDNTLEDERLITYYADPASYWITKSYSTSDATKKIEDLIYTSADEYRKEGIILRKANNSRVHGKRAVERLLEDLADGKPGLQVFSTCPETISCIPNLSLDATNGEDVDTDNYDHPYDALRYGLTKYTAMRAREDNDEINQLAERRRLSLLDKVL